ncbi:MAG: hypothetical protein R3C97_00535 [Geminicoccaceae bacterium]
MSERGFRVRGLGEIAIRCRDIEAMDGFSRHHQAANRPSPYSPMLIQLNRPSCRNPDIVGFADPAMTIFDDQRETIASSRPAESGSGSPEITFCNSLHLAKTGERGRKMGNSLREPARRSSFQYPAVQEIQREPPRG